MLDKYKPRYKIYENIPIIISDVSYLETENRVHIYILRKDGLQTTVCGRNLKSPHLTDEYNKLKKLCKNCNRPGYTSEKFSKELWIIFFNEFIKLNDIRKTIEKYFDDMDLIDSIELLIEHGILSLEWVEETILEMMGKYSLNIINWFFSGFSQYNDGIRFTTNSFKIYDEGLFNFEFPDNFYKLEKMVGIEIISNNRSVITSISDSLLNFKYLRFLTIKSKDLKSFPSSINDLTGLQDINFELSEGQWIDFSRLNNLEYITLSNFCLKELPELNPTKIVTLETTGNCISEINIDLNDFINLKNLYLGNNEIKKISIKGEYIEQVNLENNELIEIPDWLFYLDINIINLSNNHIDNIDFILKKSFPGCKIINSKKNKKISSELDLTNMVRKTDQVRTFII